MVRGEVIVRGW